MMTNAKYGTQEEGYRLSVQDDNSPQFARPPPQALYIDTQYFEKDFENETKY